ncbi:hypothetical protein AB1Y20_008456 [Prymnesium parvum]|uniref:Threonine dehydratase n=1 Tax=Prymnesium parvum TaxID=97485 RepID=A0AB34IQD1_PRYPA
MAASPVLRAFPPSKLLPPCVARHGSGRWMSGLPFRIRAPLAKLQEKKKAPAVASQAPALGDGEKLESNAAQPDYMRLALTSRVYDFVGETPLQFASGLSERVQARVFLKREDLLPTFSYKIRGAYNMLSHHPPTQKVVTYSVGSAGLSIAQAAAALKMEATVVMPERTPMKRRKAIERAGATVLIHGTSLTEAQAEAERLAQVKSELTLIPPHDNPLVIAGHATAGLEVVRQIGPAIERWSGTKDLDAIFVVAGGSSLLAGVSTVMKQIMPRTKVIGVEAAGADLLHRSLLNGHRLSVPEPAHFVDGASVTQLGSEAFRLCNELVDDIVVVSQDEICAAVRDCFEDTRAMLEPAGAVAVAGLKKYLAAVPARGDGTKGNYVVISSDASNIEFDILRFIADRAAIGEEKEKVFALRMPDRARMFYDMYQAVQPRLVTEFVYRHSPHHKDALVYMSMERADRETSGYDAQGVIDALSSLGVMAVDVTSDEMAKSHSRYLAGGRPGELPGERIIRFEFPEQAGALMTFLERLEPNWYLTMLHYRNHGGQVGKVLAGVQMPESEVDRFNNVVEGLGYTFVDETANPIFTDFMR